MIDAQSALRLHLLEASDLRTLLGGPYVYWPEIPANPGFTMPRKAIAFRFNGGSSDDQLPIQRPTINFRCYGSTAYEATSVYRELHDRLIRTGNFTVTETYSTPDEEVGFYNWREITPGQPLEDPRTGWPFMFTVWSPTIATLPIELEEAS